jgi:hypothetical protein
METLDKKFREHRRDQCQDAINPGDKEHKPPASPKLSASKHNLSLSRNQFSSFRRTAKVEKVLRKVQIHIRS